MDLTSRMEERRDFLLNNAKNMVCILQNDTIFWPKSSNSHILIHKTKKSDETFQGARTTHNDIEKTINAFALQKLATKTYTKKKQSSSKKESFENIGTPSDKRKSNIIGSITNFKKRINFKTKKKEHEKGRRKIMVEEITQKSYESQMEYLVRLYLFMILLWSYYQKLISYNMRIGR